MKSTRFLFLMLFVTGYTVAQTVNIGETTILSSDDNGNANLLLAQNITLPEIAMIQSLSFYVTTAAGNLRMGIYDASGPGGGPGVKQAETTSITPLAGWNTANVLTPVSLSAGTYWIAYLPSSNTLAFKKDVTSGTSGVFYSYNYGALPATFSTNPSTTTSHWSFYATFSSNTPPVISNVSASNLTQNSANINWNTDENADTQVEYGLTVSYGNVTSIVPALVTAHIQGLSGLTASTLYHYRVKSRDGFNNLATSGDFTFSTGAPDLIPPSDPTGLLTSLVSATQVDLTWIASTDNVGVTQYLVERCTGAGCASFTQVGTIATNAYSDLGLSPLTTYRYRVRATDAGANFSGYSNSISATTLTAPLVKVGPTGRYLVDQNNLPFMMVGDAPQALITNLSPSDVEFYFTDRQTHGFNSMWINLLCDTYTFGNSDGTTYDGIPPFTTQGDLSTPNETYFQRADSFINSAASHGLVVLLDPIETGGWLSMLEANGLTKAFNYGVYVGNRYKNFTNIIWISGNDFQSWRTASDDSLVVAVVKGIQSVDKNHLHTAELDYLVSSTLDDTLLSPLISLNAAYTYYSTYAEVLHAYNQSSTVPVFMVEAHYELEDVGGEMGTPLVLRRQEYWTMTSGATGQLYGNHYTTGFETNWKANLETEGLTELNYMKNLFTSVPWYKLIPDQNQKIITAGFGTFSASLEPGDNDYATTSRTPDGKLVIAFIPTLRAFTVDMTNLAGAVTAQWYDPTAGTYTPINGSPFTNTGTQQFTAPGNNSAGDEDWVLVLSSGDITTSLSNIPDNTEPSIKIYPNPARDKIYFNVKGAIAGVNVNIYTIDGQLVAKQNLTMQSERTMDVSGLSAGIYFVQIANEKFSSNQKIVIAR